MQGFYRLYSLSEGALTVDFGNIIDENLNRVVIALFDAWEKKKVPGIKDIIPAYSSLTIVYDVVGIRNHNHVSSAFQFMKQEVEASIKDCNWSKTTLSQLIEIPVCYDPSLAPDLFKLAEERKLTPEMVAQLHCSKTYRVYMIGFLPGFAYMGKVDERITSPRKNNPAIMVAAGSVGIAGEQTGIYPLESPGGWNIIGQTPLQLFDAKRNDPVLLKAGDEVLFVTITLKQFHDLKSKL